MGTIAEKLRHLAETKTAIKNAIMAKGVHVAESDTFRSYATKIGEISGENSGSDLNIPSSFDDHIAYFAVKHLGDATIKILPNGYSAWSYATSEDGDVWTPSVNISGGTSATVNLYTYPGQIHITYIRVNDLAMYVSPYIEPVQGVCEVTIKLGLGGAKFLQWQISPEIGNIT